jgi:hypothetical protein
MMPSDSTKTLVDLREEVSFRVGGIKNPRFLFPAKKAVDACREEVKEARTRTRRREVKGGPVRPDQTFTLRDILFHNNGYFHSGIFRICFLIRL